MTWQIWNPSSLSPNLRWHPKNKQKNHHFAFQGALCQLFSCVLTDLVLVKINTPFGTVRAAKYMQGLKNRGVHAGKKALTVPHRTQPTLNNSGFCPYSVKDKIPFEAFAWLLEWTVHFYTRVHAAACVFRSRWRDIKQPVWMNSAPLSRAPLQNCSPVVAAVCITMFFETPAGATRAAGGLCRDKRATLNATAGHTSAMDNGRKKNDTLSDRSFKIVCALMRSHVSPGWESAQSCSFFFFWMCFSSHVISYITLLRGAKFGKSKQNTLLYQGEY